MRADLALVGFGHVGRRFARLLDEQRDWLSRDYDLDCRIVGIATRHHGGVFDAVGRRRGRAGGRASSGAAPASRDARAAGRRDSLDVIRALAAEPTRRCACVVETTTLDIDAGQPAIDHVRAALAAGCHVVTANKGPAAFAYDELSALRARDRALVPLRRRGDGRRADLQPGARDAAGGRDRRLSRRRQQHHQPHPDARSRTATSFDAGAGADAGGGHRGSRPVARRRRLGRGGEDRGARQRADATRGSRRSVEREGIGPATARLAMAAQGARRRACGWWRRRRPRRRAS